MRVYQFRVSIIGIPKIYRIIEASENCTFDDLHEEIFDAFNRYDPHLYSFFITKKDTKNVHSILGSPELTHPQHVENIMGFGRKKKSTARTRIGDVGLEEKDVFHYLFDFGDDWWHRIRVQSVKEVKRRKKSIKIIKSIGESPPQYPDYDDDFDEDEIKMLADAGAKVSHNPESSMKLGAGVAPVPAMLKQGVIVGLGTDGCASNNDLDLLLEMDTAAKIHKLTTMDPTVMDAATVLRMATIDGAKLLGLEGKIGSIEVGKCADIIILDTNKPHLTPMYNCYSHIVYAASGSDISTSIIDGKIVMKDRRLLNMDILDIMDRVRKIASNIGNHYSA